MLKGMGCLLVSVSAVWVWLGQLRAWRREEQTLLSLLTVLEQMSAAIRITRTPLPRLFRQLGGTRQDVVGRWLEAMAGEIQDGQPLREVWARGCAALTVGATEREVLLRLQLSGDEEQICKAISLARDELAEHLREKRQSCHDKMRQSAAVCFSGAALVMILLL